MWYHTLVSTAILAFPIAITLGIYMGVEIQKVIHYPVYPIFPGTGANGGPGGDGSAIVGVQTQQFCQKSYGITPYPGQYTFNPNQWGDAANTGTLCMNITTDSVTAVANAKQAAQFTSTWSYPQGPASEPVHAFPNAKIQSTAVTLPITLANLATLDIDVDWAYALGSANFTGVTDNDSLSGANVNANVCIDMFFADDKANANSTTLSNYEVMIWFGRWGPSTQPIGEALGSQLVATINGTTFDLYYGTNSVQQKVYTWVAQSNTTSFTGDLSPLMENLANLKGPDADTFLGYVAFGSEALWSPQNVTFSVMRLSMEVTGTSS